MWVCWPDVVETCLGQVLRVLCAASEGKTVLGGVNPQERSVKGYRQAV